MTRYEEERIAELLAALPPAPEGWIQAAAELPRARRELDQLVERALEDARFREQVLADLEAAVRDSGHEPNPALIAALRARLAE